eukprot:jgi/Psemu1/41382/gm1.41382_g
MPRPTQEVLRYHKTLLMLMDFLHECKYPTDKMFTRDELLALITPEDIYRWMCFKVLGESSTLMYWKKAISYFMPSHATWNEATCVGNPTKSRRINNLNKAFLQVLDLAKGHGIVQLRHQAMLKFQLCMIGRGTIHPILTYPDYITSQMRWFKNAQDKGDCPVQLLMGAMDHGGYCVLLGLAIYLEVWLSAARQGSKFRYFNREVVWSCMETRLLNCDNNVNTAINKIMCAYGNVSITNLIKAMSADEQ